MIGTLLTTCFRTSLWKTWDGFMPLGSISRRLMIWKKQRGQNSLPIKAQSVH